MDPITLTIIGAIVALGYTAYVFKADVISSVVNSAVNLLTYLLALFAEFCKKLVLMATVIMSEFEQKANHLNEIDALRDLWKHMRDLANFLLIFVLFGAMVLVIFRYEKGNYTIKRVMPTLVSSVFLVSFSSFIVFVVIDVFNIAAGGIYRLLLGQTFSAAEAVKNTLATFNIPELTSQIRVLNDAKDNATNADLLIFTIFMFIVVFTVTVGAITVMIVFVTRFVALAFLLIVSPVVFIARVLPKFEKYTEQFWEKLVHYAALPTLAAAYFSLAYIMSDFLQKNIVGSSGCEKMKCIFGSIQISFDWGNLLAIAVTLGIYKKVFKLLSDDQFAKGIISTVESKANQWGKKAARGTFDAATYLPRKTGEKAYSVAVKTPLKRVGEFAGAARQRIAEKGTTVAADRNQSFNKRVLGGIARNLFETKEAEDKRFKESNAYQRVAVGKEEMLKASPVIKASADTAKQKAADDQIGGLRDLAKLVGKDGAGMERIRKGNDLRGYGEIEGIIEGANIDLEKNIALLNAMAKGMGALVDEKDPSVTLRNLKSKYEEQRGKGSFRFARTGAGGVAELKQKKVTDMKNSVTKTADFDAMLKDLTSDKRSEMTPAELEAAYEGLLAVLEEPPKDMKPQDVEDRRRSLAASMQENAVQATRVSIDEIISGAAGGYLSQRAVEDLRKSQYAKANLPVQAVAGSAELGSGTPPTIEYFQGKQNTEGAEYDPLDPTRQKNFVGGNDRVRAAVQGLNTKDFRDKVLSSAPALITALSAESRDAGGVNIEDSGATDAFIGAHTNRTENGWLREGEIQNLIKAYVPLSQRQNDVSSALAGRTLGAIDASPQLQRYYKSLTLNEGIFKDAEEKDVEMVDERGVPMALPNNYYDFVTYMATGAVLQQKP